MSERAGSSNSFFWGDIGDSEALPRYRSLVNAVDDGIYQLDADGLFTAVNDSIVELTGYAREDLLGEHVSLLLDTDDSTPKQPLANPPRRSEQFEFDVQTAGGDAVRCEVRVNPLEADETVQRTVGIVRAASHDLQEPLRMVTSYLQLLERRYGDAFDEDGEEFLQYAVDGAERMREMIDALLEYSRIETRGDPFEPVDLNEVLDDVLADLQMQIAESDADVTVEELPRVEGDASQLRQLFQNLLDNAITYSGDEPPLVHVDADRRGDEWAISVEDDGVGIEPDEQERVFTIFDRLHSREEYEGTGIGLALCQRIVNRHGGEIWVESEPGEGATFSVTLPTASERDP